jgi:hypothetical protein
LISKLILSPSSVPGYTMVNGLLKFKNRIWIGTNPNLQHQIISALHCSVLGGHSGIPVTYRRLKSMFAWPGMKKSVELFVQAY